VKYYLSGVAGTGMNALAQYLIADGHVVYGSDRAFDKGENEEYKSFLNKKGIHLVKQDGRILDKSFDACIFSAAVEEKVPDYIRARELDLPVISRSIFLKNIYNEKQGIGVAGTSGKTTVTGMLATIMIENNRDCSVVCGAEILNYSDHGMGGNCIYSNAPLFLAEVDESDKVIDQYRSQLALVTNISEDHMPISEALSLFRRFIEKSKLIVYNKDCSETKNLVEAYGNEKIGFSLVDSDADVYIENIKTGKSHCTFSIESVHFRINIPGKYNVENAAAAVTVAKALGISLQQSSRALKHFSGIKGRFERMHEKIFYDFAHNPAKIDSLLATATALYSSILIYYQPHGYTPFRTQFDALISIFHERLRAEDILIIGKIFDAGGSVRRDISSSELAGALNDESFSVFYMTDRREITGVIKEKFNLLEAFFVVGARDRSLRDFSREIITYIK
jgi:UDP-N-acetylmuramate--alanine ligase